MIRHPALLLILSLYTVYAFSEHNSVSLLDLGVELLQLDGVTMLHVHTNDNTSVPQR